MKGRFYFFRKGFSSPVMSEDGELPEKATDEDFLLHAAKTLFKDCEFTFIPDDLELKQYNYREK